MPGPSAIDDASFKLAMHLAKQEARVAFGKSSTKQVSDKEALALQDKLWTNRPTSPTKAVHNPLPTPAVAKTTHHRSVSPPQQERDADVWTLSSVDSQNDAPPSPLSPASTAPSSLSENLGIRPQGGPYTTDPEKLAAVYLDGPMAQQGRFAWSDVAYFAAPVLRAAVHVWQALPEAPSYIRLAAKYAYAYANRAIDIVHKPGHFQAFGPKAPGLHSQVEYVRANERVHTTGDGNCFFHALAQQQDYLGYNSATPEVQAKIAQSLRRACVSEARTQMRNGNEEAIAQLAHCSMMEADDILQKMENTAGDVRRYGAEDKQDAQHQALERVIGYRNELAPWTDAGLLSKAQDAKLASIIDTLNAL